MVSWSYYKVESVFAAKVDCWTDFSRIKSIKRKFPLYRENQRVNPRNFEIASYFCVCLTMETKARDEGNY